MASPAAAGNRERLAAALRMILPVGIVAANLWLADSVFLPWLVEGRRADYVLVGASWSTLGVCLALAIAATTMLLRLGGGSSSLGWLAVSLIPLLNLVPWAAGRLPALSYVLFDLRYAWWAAVLVAMVMRLGAVRPAFAWVSAAPKPRWLPVAVLVAVPIVVAIATTPQLRFSGVLHGDEPKYLRFCENLYQGRGFDVSGKRLLKDLAPGDVPRISANLGHLVEAVREEGTLMAEDLAALVGRSRSTPRLVSGQPGASMFFAGKHPGTVYQLHNPGLSFLLLPGYYIDRRLTGSGVGYQDEFPARMPSVHATLLILYAAYALALFALLRAYSGDDALSAVLALAGMLMLPTSAFAFQIYPEIPAGLIVFLLARTMITGLPGSLAACLGAGLLAGFLPWLHVRNLAVVAVVTIWLLAAPGAPLRRRLGFALGAALGVAALCLYTYRLTGSFAPIATYGSDAPLSLGRMLRGLPGFTLDRVWGLLPHAPFYLVGLAGCALTLRRSARAFAAVVLLLVAMALPAAGHGYWAGGSTPGRYLVASAPLALIFVVDAWRGWRDRPWFTGAAAMLALISVETAVRYNLHHRKEVGPLVAPAFAGWRPNLLFPSLGTDTWTATSVDVALLAGWAIGAAVLVAAAWIAMRPAEPTMPDVSRVRRGGLAHVFGTLLLVAALGTALSPLTGLSTAREYIVSPRDARERALGQFAGLSGCSLCWFSALGSVDPATALGNQIDRIFFRSWPGSPRAGERATVLVRPRSTTGEYVIASFVVDLGDGTRVVEPRFFGDLRIDHVYGRPGDYEVRAWVRWKTDSPVESQLRVAIAP